MTITYNKKGDWHETGWLPKTVILVGVLCLQQTDGDKKTY